MGLYLARAAGCQDRGARDVVSVKYYHLKTVPRELPNADDTVLEV